MKRKIIVCILSLLLVVTACENQTNHDKEGTAQSSAQTKKEETNKSEDYSGWARNFSYYYVQSSGSTMMFSGINFESDKTVELYRSGAEIMAARQGNPLKGTYTISNYEGDEKIDSYDVTEPGTINGTEPETVRVTPEILIEISIPRSDLEQVGDIPQDQIGQSSEPETQKLYGYKTNQGQYVLTSGERVKGVLMVLHHPVPTVTEFIVNVDSANVHERPEIDSKVITTLNKGESVVVSDWINGDEVDNKSSWSIVDISGETGYIWAGFLLTKAAYETNSNVVQTNGTMTSQSSADSSESSLVSSQQDLDIDAINTGDLSTLVGTWANGKGDVLVINADGTTNDNQTIHSVKDSNKTSKVPYASISNGMTGAAIGLFRVGFLNPDGDSSDTTKPRIIITQNSGNYPADSYYYRQ